MTYGSADVMMRHADTVLTITIDNASWCREINGCACAFHLRQLRQGARAWARAFCERRLAI